MINILHVNTTMNIGGIESFLMGIIRNVDKSKYNIKFICYKNSKFDYEDEIESLGIKIIRISDPKKIGLIKHILEIKNIIEKENIDIVHSHTYFDSAYVSIAARLAKTKMITHSHTTEGLNNVGIKRKIKWKIAKKIIKNNSNLLLACSKEAGKALFENRSFRIINNAIDIEKFSFSKEIRNKIRNKYNINDNEILIGHIGRFDTPKNHKFIIEIFNDLVKENNNYKLMLVGDGNKFNEIKELVKENNIEPNVIFVGSVKDTYNYYNAFDLFVFPSIYEGLGISLIEAQANGLPSLISKSIPKEAILNANVKIKPFNKEEWIKEIKSLNIKRIDIVGQLNSYNIKEIVKELEKIYTKL
ncbi:MAG: glycosyltransferase [Bacilli bacterium]|nr:glycosyltransferase [Bacilli bacterium]